MAFRQLKLSDRKSIEALLHRGCSQAAIARALSVHRSTIKHEVARNSVQGIYKAEKAQQLAHERKQTSRKPYKTLPVSASLRIRMQKDRRTPRPERRRLSRPKFEWLQIRAWLWSRRERIHIWESFARSARDWRDWLNYSYGAGRYMRINKKHRFISKYERISRTFLGKLPSRYYRVNPFARFFKVPSGKYPYAALSAVSLQKETVGKESDSGRCFSESNSSVQTNVKILTRSLQSKQADAFSSLEPPTQGQLVELFLNYDQIILISRRYQQRHSGRLVACIHGRQTVVIVAQILQENTGRICNLQVVKSAFLSSFFISFLSVDLNQSMLQLKRGAGWVAGDKNGYTSLLNTQNT